MVLVLVGFLVLGVGLWCLARGLRGRRTGLDPHCRACGFNVKAQGVLTHLAATSATEPPRSARCPECGRDLLAPDAIRIGRLARRPRPLWIGLALIAIALPTAGLGLRSTFSAANTVSLLPTSALLLQLRSGTQSMIEAAAGELDARSNANKLTPAELDALLQQTLAVQADPSILWTAPLQSLLSQLHVTPGLSSAQQVQYLRNTITGIAVQCRPRVAADAGLPITLSFEQGRDTGTNIWTSIRVRSLVIDGQLNLVPRVAAVNSFQNGVQRTETLILPLRLPPGPHTIDIEFGFVDQAGAIREDFLIHREKLSVEVLPAGQRSAMPISTPPPSELARLLTVDRVMIIDQQGPAGMGGAQRQRNISINLKIDPLPVPLSFDVEIRRARPDAAAPTPPADEEPITRMSLMILKPGGHGSSTSLRSEVTLTDGDLVDLFLRSNPDRVEQTADITSFWDGELVLRSVPVSVISPARRGTPPTPLSAPSPNPAPSAPAPEPTTADHLARLERRQADSAPDIDFDLSTLLSRIDGHDPASGPLADSFASVIDTLLDRQASRDNVWWDTDAPVLERAIAKGLLTPQQRARYHSQILPPITLSAPARLWPDNPSVTLSHPAYRVGSRTDATIEMFADAVRIGGQAIALPPEETPRLRAFKSTDWQNLFSNLGQGPQSTFYSRQLKLPSPIQPGRHPIEVDYVARIWAGGQDAVGRGEPLATTRQSLTTTIQVLPAGELGIAIRRDSASRDQIIAAIDPAASRAFLLTDDQNRLHAGGDFSIKNPPLTAGFDILWQPVDQPPPTSPASPASDPSSAQANQLRLGSFVLKPRSNPAVSFTESYGVVPWHRPKAAGFNQLPDWILAAKRVRIVLRPSPRLAAEQTDAAETWAGDDLILGDFDLARGTFEQR